MKKIESLVLSWRKSGKSDDEIEKELHVQNLLKGSGSNIDLWTDLKDMNGRILKKLPREELNSVFAEIMKNRAESKTIQMRDRVWSQGIHCYRRDICYFKNRMARDGFSPEHYIKEVEKTQTDKPSDSFPVIDFRVLRDLVDRHGKAKVERVIRDAF